MKRSNLAVISILLSLVHSSSCSRNDENGISPENPVIGSIVRRDLSDVLSAAELASTGTGSFDRLAENDGVFTWQHSGSVYVIEGAPEGSTAYRLADPINLERLIFGTPQEQSDAACIILDVESVSSPEVSTVRNGVLYDQSTQVFEWRRDKQTGMILLAGREADPIAYLSVESGTKKKRFIVKAETSDGAMDGWAEKQKLLETVNCLNATMKRVTGNSTVFDDPP